MLRWLLPFLLITTVARADPASLQGAVIMGYQGWFRCDDDRGPRVATGHWFTDPRRSPQATFDALPDVAELPPEARCPTPLRGRDGHPVEAFDSAHPAVADQHMAWLQAQGVQGVALQRFVSQLTPRLQPRVDTVLANLLAAAGRHGRSLLVMYDLSAIGAIGQDRIVQDWREIIARGVTRDPAYQRHAGAPVMGLWGIGGGRIGLTPRTALDLLRAVRATGPVTLLCGTAKAWRGYNADKGEDWEPVWRECDVISPWSVGTYRNEAEADLYADRVLQGDIAARRAIGKALMPVVFPGFSWQHLMQARDRSAPLNAIPRACGRFFWRQVVNATRLQAGMLYVAMFDELDEGTAMFKMLPRQAQVPEGFMALDQDGCAVPNDWYLRLAGAAQAALRSGRPAGDVIPLR